MTDFQCFFRVRFYICGPMHVIVSVPYITVFSLSEHKHLIFVRLKGVSPSEKKFFIIGGVRISFIYLFMQLFTSLPRCSRILCCVVFSFYNLRYYRKNYCSYHILNKVLIREYDLGNCSGTFKGKVQFIFLCNPPKSSVNVFLMKILKSTVTKKVIVCFNLGEENFQM